MPIPGPERNEQRDDFISRCMGNDVMNREFPDQKQRAAVCFSTWRKHKGQAQDAYKKAAKKRGIKV